MLTLATWNLMRPVYPARRELFRQYLDRVAPDILVLTENHDEFQHGLPHVHSSAVGRDGWARDRNGHRWVTICSRFEVVPLPTRDNSRSAAALILLPGGRSLIVFGTVLPWRTSSWRDQPWAQGAAFAASLSEQALDWSDLRAQNPGSDLIVLGDFNQELGFKPVSGTLRNQALLADTLHRHGLHAATGGDGDPVARRHSPRACIDHICLPREWAFDAAQSWPNVLEPSLTDHFGVAVRAMPKP